MKDHVLGKFSPPKTVINDTVDKGKGPLMHQFEIGGSSNTKSKKNISFHFPSIKCSSFDHKLTPTNILSYRNSPKALKEDSRNKNKKKESSYKAIYG